VLPDGSAPARVGSFVRVGNDVHVVAAAGVDMRVNGEVADARVLRNDMVGGPADMVTLGTLTMFVIERGERYGIRLRDSANPAREAFTGRIWYEPQDDYIVTAQYTAYAAPQILLVPNVLGDTEEQESPGFVTFELNGQECRLAPTIAGGRLFFVIRDTTSGHGTYGMGRFLMADMPQDGQVMLDFNRAYNPPCAFTDFATCPMPPRENHLRVAITAGERLEGHQH
jgi:uncharacterized protein (DUF1684 family)